MTLVVVGNGWWGWKWSRNDGRRVLRNSPIPIVVHTLLSYIIRIGRIVRASRKLTNDLGNCWLPTRTHLRTNDGSYRFSFSFPSLLLHFIIICCRHYRYPSSHSLRAHPGHLPHTHLRTRLLSFSSLFLFVSFYFSSQKFRWSFVPYWITRETVVDGRSYGKNVRKDSCCTEEYIRLVYSIDWECSDVDDWRERTIDLSLSVFNRNDAIRILNK